MIKLSDELFLLHFCKGCTVKYCQKLINILFRFLQLFHTMSNLQSILASKARQIVSGELCEPVNTLPLDWTPCNWSISNAEISCYQAVKHHLDEYFPSEDRVHRHPNHAQTLDFLRRFADMIMFRHADPEQFSQLFLQAMYAAQFGIVAAVYDATSDAQQDFQCMYDRLRLIADGGHYNVGIFCPKLYMPVVRNLDAFLLEDRLSNEQKRALMAFAAMMDRDDRKALTPSTTVFTQFLDSLQVSLGVQENVEMMPFVLGVIFGQTARKCIDRLTLLLDENDPTEVVVNNPILQIRGSRSKTLAPKSETTSTTNPRRSRIFTFFDKYRTKPE